MVLAFGHGIPCRSDRAQPRAELQSSHLCPAGLMGPGVRMSLGKIADTVRIAAERCRPGPRVSLPWLRSRESRESFVLEKGEEEAIRAQMEALNPEDLGVSVVDFSKRKPPGATPGSPSISYIQVVEDPDMLIAMFVLPPGASIPTHSHPMMYVFTRVLEGKLHVQEYDIVEPCRRANMFRAVQYKPSVSVAGDVRVLSPGEKNIHSFHAESWTSVLDVVVPPYGSSPQRSCRYYTRIAGEESESLQADFTDTVLLQVSRNVLESKCISFRESRLRLRRGLGAQKRVASECVFDFRFSREIASSAEICSRVKAYIQRLS